MGRPDAFLRRVMAQREAEQERVLLEPVVRIPCRVCGERLNLGEDLTRTVCTACGGRDRQTQLEKEERGRQWLLGLVGIMADDTERKTCKTEGCGTPLRSDNQSGICRNCFKAGIGRGKAESAGARADGGAVRKPRSDIRKRFKIVAEALGQDADGLINKFCASWLDRVASSVQVSGD